MEPTQGEEYIERLIASIELNPSIRMDDEVDLLASLLAEPGRAEALVERLGLWEELEPLPRRLAIRLVARSRRDAARRAIRARVAPRPPGHTCPKIDLTQAAVRALCRAASLRAPKDQEARDRVERAALRVIELLEDVRQMNAQLRDAYYILRDAKDLEAVVP